MASKFSKGKRTSTGGAVYPQKLSLKEKMALKYLNNNRFKVSTPFLKQAKRLIDKELDYRIIMSPEVTDGD